MNCLMNSVAVFLITVLVLLYTKPRMMFHCDGTWKEFGLCEHESLVTFPIVSVFAGMLGYYMCLMGTAF